MRYKELKIIKWNYKDYFVQLDFGLCISQVSKMKSSIVICHYMVVTILYRCHAILTIFSFLLVLSMFLLVCGAFKHLIVYTVCYLLLTKTLACRCKKYCRTIWYHKGKIMSSVKFAKDNKIDCSCHFSENSSLVVQLTFSTYELVPFFNGQIYYGGKYSRTNHHYWLVRR